MDQAEPLGEGSLDELSLAHKGTKFVVPPPMVLGTYKTIAYSPSSQYQIAGGLNTHTLVTILALGS